jgi:hypothetical protein
MVVVCGGRMVVSAALVVVVVAAAAASRRGRRPAGEVGDGGGGGRAVVVVGGAGSGGGGSGGGGGRRWWGQGSRLVGPLPWNCFFLFYESSFAESFSTPGTRVTSGSDVALGKGLFDGPAVPRALCRELPLGRSCAEWKPSCAESMLLSAQAANPVVSAGIERRFSFQHVHQTDTTRYQANCIIKKWLQARLSLQLIHYCS